jgi:hypothetical protein
VIIPKLLAGAHDRPSGDARDRLYALPAQHLPDNLWARAYHVFPLIDASDLMRVDSKTAASPGGCWFSLGFHYWPALSGPSQPPTAPAN